MSNPDGSVAAEDALPPEREGDDYEPEEPDWDAIAAMEEDRDYRVVGSGVSTEWWYYRQRVRYIASDLQGLRDALGDRVLGAFMRCFLGMDRLLSLGRLVRAVAKSQDAARERFTLLWMICGTVRELVKAVENLSPLGQRLSGSDLEAWRELQRLVKGWSRAPILKRVRDTMAFHLDERHELFSKGIEAVAAENEPHVLFEGDQGSVSSAPFAHAVMLAGLFPDPRTRIREFQAFQASLGRVRKHIGRLVLKLFLAAIKRAPGPTALQTERARLIRLLNGRRSRLAIESFTDEAGEPFVLDG